MQPIPESPTSPSYFAYWREILATLAAFGALVGVVAVAVFDSQFMRAFDRCRDRITNRLDLWYEKRITENAATAQAVSANSDRLEGLEAAIMKQGEALQSQLGQHFTQNTTALQNVTAALTAVQKEAQATAEAVARIEGFIEGGNEWTGVNRRKRTRRKPSAETK